MKALIAEPRSVIPALDMRDLYKLMDIVRGVHGVPGIGGYKIGSIPVGAHGMSTVVSAIRKISKLPIIYDPQKGGTDIPDLGAGFADMVYYGGANAVILFPFGGAVTERKWIEACQDVGLTVLVEAEMTQEGFFEEDGGFIARSAPGKIFEIAASMGVTDFVVPGNKISKVAHYRKLLESLVADKGNLTLYAPGFISQGGDITETGQVAGENWHAIVGSALYERQGLDGIRETAVRLTQQILVPA